MDPEQSLIARAQQGDIPAYETLVRQYEQIVFRGAYLVLHDEQEAADAAQDAFLRAYRALRSFELGQAFRPWILRIVTNLALNRVESARRRERMTERYGREQVMMNPAEPSPDHSVVEREQNERLLQAVHKLPPGEQALIGLRYFLELPEKQVAESLGIPLGTVKSRLHRALAHLREIIRRDFPDLQHVVE